MKKHLFHFQGGVEFLRVNSTLLFEGGGGGGVGFYFILFYLFIYLVTFALCKTFVIFSNF